MKNKYWYGFIVLIQVALCYLAFPFHFQNHFDTSFVNYGDGLKNNFTLIQFVKEPIGEKGIFHFEFFQYPYGDYVYTADNTPGYAILMRWINHHIADVSTLTIPIFNILLLSNFVVCALLLFYLSKRIYRSNYWALGIAILLPFALEQGLRVIRGHFNLSLSSIFALGLVLCYAYSRRVQQQKSIVPVLIGMFALSIIGFFVHGYYLPILTILFSFYLLFFHIKDYFSKRSWFKIFIPASLVAAIGLVVFSIMKVTDGYFDLRPRQAKHYDSIDQRLSPSYLFLSNNFNSINFPLRTTDYGNLSESHQYLGHGFWALFILTFFFCLMSTIFRRKVFESLQSLFQQPFLFSLLLTAFVLFAIACGDRFFSHQIHLISIRFLNVNWQESSVQSIVTFLSLLVVAAGSLLIIIAGVMKLRLPKQWEGKDRIQLLIIVCLVAVLSIFYFSNTIQIRRETTNWVNPFFYLRKVTTIVEQFRSLARFTWPFSMIACIILLYVFIQSLPVLHKWMRIGAILIISALSISHLADWLVYNRQKGNKVNLFSEQILAKVPAIDKDKYAAILPIPVFMVGSEDYTVTIDDFDDFSEDVYQIIYKNQVPTMASKLSRTPRLFADQMMDVIIQKKLSDKMFQSGKFDKPILVIVSKKQMGENKDAVMNRVQLPEENKKADAASKAQFDFLKKPNLNLIKTEGGLDFYAWDGK